VPFCFNHSHNFIPLNENIRKEFVILCIIDAGNIM